MSRDLIHKLSGFSFFLFALTLSFLAARRFPSILAWVNVFHNGLLAFLYCKRKPARDYDRFGLWLGLLAAFLPTLSFNTPVQGYILLPALAAYFLVLWSLLTLGHRFGIAPADRGLTMKGPYRFVRHPMYLGELIFQSMLVFCSRSYFLALFEVLVLVGLQSWRIIREERILSGYSTYRENVRWRLLPGVW